MSFGEDLYHFDFLLKSIFLQNLFAYELLKFHFIIIVSIYNKDIPSANCPNQQQIGNNYDQSWNEHNKDGVYV